MWDSAKTVTRELVAAILLLAMVSAVGTLIVYIYGMGDYNAIFGDGAPNLVHVGSHSAHQHIDVGGVQSATIRIGRDG